MKRLIVSALMILCFAGVPAAVRADDTPWQRVLQERVNQYGSRNWIIIADAGFPLLSSEGVETVQTGADPVEVLKTVLDDLQTGRRLRAKASYPSELRAIAEADAPGITQYRSAIDQVLTSRETTTAAFDDLLTQAIKQSDTYRVLVLRTNQPMPYSSIFLQLDYANWSSEADARLHNGQVSK